MTTNQDSENDHINQIKNTTSISESTNHAVNVNIDSMEFHNRKIYPDTIKPCTDCRMKKVKCLGNLPCCARCKKFGLQCDLENYVFYNYSTVQSLMQKIQQLEKTLRGENSNNAVSPGKTEISNENHTSLSTTSLSLSKSTDSTNDLRNNSAGLQFSETSSDSEHLLSAGGNNVISLDELSNEVGSLTSANNDNTQGKYIGAATGSNFAKAFLKQMHLQKLDEFNHLSANDFSGFDANSALYSTSCATLPPYSITKAAIDVFITIVHPYYPILSLKEFFDVVELMYTSPHSLSYYQKYLVFIVIAIGLERGEKHKELTNYYNQFKPVEFFNTASKYLDKVVNSRSVDVLEMLLLSMVWLNNTNVFKDDFGDMWYLGRYLMSLAMELNLHLKLNSDNMTDATIEHRRRLFWVTYLLERKNAVKFGRGLSIKRQEIETEYPRVTHDDYLNVTKLKDTYGKVFFTPLLLAIELYDIYGLLLETVYISRTKGVKPQLSDDEVLNYKREISEQVIKWVGKLENELPKTMIYHHVLRVKAMIINVMLNRPSPSFPSPDRESIIKCKESCLEAISSFEFLTARTSLWKTDPSCLHDLVNIGLTMIFCCWKTENDSELLKSFSTTTIEVMNDMIKYYPSFIKFKNLYIIVSTIIIQNLDKVSKSNSSENGDISFQDIPSPLQHLKQNMMKVGAIPQVSTVPLAPMMPPPQPQVTLPTFSNDSGPQFKSVAPSSAYTIRQKNSHLRSGSLYDDAQSPMGTPVYLHSKPPVQPGSSYMSTTAPTSVTMSTTNSGSNQAYKRQQLHPLTRYPPQGYQQIPQPPQPPPQQQQQQQQQQLQQQPVASLSSQQGMPQRYTPVGYGYGYQVPQQGWQLQQGETQGNTQGIGQISQSMQPPVHNGYINNTNNIGIGQPGYVDSMTQELFQDVFKNYYQGNDNIREDLDQLFEFQRFNWA